MNEAKQKRKLRDKILSANPYCIYCGGSVAAATIDHVPPRAVFDYRHRPQGLEFSACEECNNGGRLDEQIAALISRMYPNVQSAAQREDIKRLMDGVANNAPGLLREMLPHRAQERHALKAKGVPPNAHALNLTPRVQRALNSFSGKIAFALHYERTNRIIPIGGAARAWFTTNYQHMTKGIPQEFLEIVGSPKTLKQGSKSVADQFQYWSEAAEDNPGVSVHFATFRYSFAVYAFVSEDAARHADLLEGKDERTLFAPGWLKQPAA